MEMGREGVPGQETVGTKTEYLTAVSCRRQTSPLENGVEGPGRGGLFCLVKDFLLHPEGDVEPFGFVTEAGHIPVVNRPLCGEKGGFAGGKVEGSSKNS